MLKKSTKHLHFSRERKRKNKPAAKSL